MTLPASYLPSARVYQARPPRALGGLHRAMIIHRSDVVSAGVATILATGTGCEVSAVVPSVYEAFRVARSNPPRIIFFEYDGHEGMESASLLAGIAPRPTLVALVGAGEPVTPGECLAAGADTVIGIDNVSREMFQGAVRSTLGGTPSIVVGFNGGAVRQDRGGALASDVSDILTPRERQMLYLIGEGLTNREIAEILVLSIKTIETHRANLSRKLNIRSRAGLMRLAMSGAVPSAAIA